MLTSPFLQARHSTDQLKLILTRAFPNCPTTPDKTRPSTFPYTTLSTGTYLRINITQKSRGSPEFKKRNPPPGPWLPRQRKGEGLKVRNLGGQETVPGPFVVAGHVCYQCLVQGDSLTLCRRRRTTTARARPSASQPAALFGWPHAAGSNLNPPSPFSSTHAFALIHAHIYFILACFLRSHLILLPILGLSTVSLCLSLRFHSRARHSFFRSSVQTFNFPHITSETVQDTGTGGQRQPSHDGFRPAHIQRRPEAARAPPCAMQGRASSSCTLNGQPRPFPAQRPRHTAVGGRRSCMHHHRE